MSIFNSMNRPFLTTQPWAPSVRPPMTPPQVMRGPQIGPTPQYGGQQRQQQQPGGGGIYNAIGNLFGGQQGQGGQQGGGLDLARLLAMLGGGA